MTPRAILSIAHTTSRIEFGRTRRYGEVTTTSAEPRWLQFHRLRGLRPGTTYYFRPVVVTDPTATLDSVLGQFVVEADDRNDNIVDRDVVVFWTEDNRRIVTGADILGRLLRGIARREKG